jgi:ketosteroid isomerase-like protein
MIALCFIIPALTAVEDGMKRIQWVVTALCLAFPYTLAFGQNGSESSSSEQQIKTLEEQRNQAILHGDAAALERMTSDDYTFITLRGELRTKTEIVKGFQSGSFKYESRTISDLKVRVYGDAAIVTGRSSQKGKENGKDYSGDYRFTRVYAKQNGHWVSVALQTTLIQP